MTSFNLAIRTKQKESRTTSFLFLNFPLNIRNKIYGLIATTDVNEIFIGPNRRSVVKGSHSLLLLCRQIKSEFSDILNHVAIVTTPTICGRVIDFDFSSLLGLLNLLGNHPGARLSDFKGDDPTRTLVVELKVTPKWSTDPDVEVLRKWLTWLSKKARKDLEPEILYFVKHVDDVPAFQEFLLSVGRGLEPSPVWDRILHALVEWQYYGNKLQEEKDVQVELIERRRREEFDRMLDEEYDELDTESWTR